MSDAVDNGDDDLGNFRKTLENRRAKNQKKISDVSRQESEAAQDEPEVAPGNSKMGARQKMMEQARLKMSQKIDQTSKSEETESPRRTLLSTTQELMGSRPGSSLSPRPSSALSGGGTLSDTIRQRMADKIRNAKDKGKDTAYTEARTSSRRLAGIRGRSELTRFDDPDVKISRQLDETLEKSLQTRRKWKEAAAKSAPGEGGVSAQQQFDFFTRTVWTPEPSDDEEQDKESVPGQEGDGDGEKDVDTQEPEEEAEEGTSRARKRKKKEVAEDEEQLLMDDDKIVDEVLYSVSRADYTPLRERLEKENEIFFYPTQVPVPVSDKLFVEDVEPRKLEDEGLFVGKRPPESAGNIARMEQRLLQEKEKGQAWFGEDGAIVALADPLKESASRPPILEEVPPHLKTDFCKALPLLTNGRLTSAGLGSLDADKFQVDVDVNTLVFTHHHLFSREHVLAQQLTSLYRQYVVRGQKKSAVNLTEKLKALKAAAEHAQQSQKSSKNKKENPLMQSWDFRLQEYMEEIRQTRLQRDNELRADRTLLKNILQTWKEIKSLRTFQKFTCTPVKLQIKKEPCDSTVDELEWQKEIDDELSERQAEIAQMHQRQMNEYKEKMEICKEKRTAFKEAQKRQRRRDRLADRGRDVDTTEEEQQQAEKDNDLLREGEPEKPEKPTLSSTEEQRKFIREEYMEIRRLPGEPLIIPELSNSAHVTADNKCPRGEISRKNDVNRSKIFIKVLFNDKEVSRTSVKPLSQHFTVSFAQIFSVQIMQWPESIKLQIIESTLLGSTLLSEVYAVIPDANVTADTVNLEDMEFSSNVKVAHNHEGVGSDVLFSFMSDGTNKQSLLTTGTLSTSVSWAVDELGNVLIPPSNNQKNQHYHAMHKLDAVSAIGVSGLSDIDKLTKWIVESRLDPNEPSNAAIMAMIKPTEGGIRKHPQHFRLEQLQGEFDFVTDEELNASPRFKLLQYREIDELAEFTSYTMVPAFDSEVNHDVFKDYEKKHVEEKPSELLDDLVSQRAAIAKYMQRVQRQVMMRFKKASKQLQLQDIVREDAVPNIATIIPGIKKTFEPRRPLKPQRKERKAVTNQNIQETGVRLLVNIVRAFGVPIRSDESRSVPATSPQSTQQFGTTGPGGPMDGPQSYIDNVSVCPFVEVMFQRETYATSVAESANPSWNEELQIKFRPPGGDYRLTNLQTVTDVVYINLFDEYVTEVLHDDRDRGTTVQRRVEKRWLGNIKIPFSTIYFSPNARIEGTFRVERPPVLLGYDTSTPSRPSYGGATMGQTGGGGGQTETNDTYISLFVTLDPPLTPPDAPNEKFDSNEDEKLIRESVRWQSELQTKFPKREFKLQVIDINGQSVFITRYLKAVKPPEELINNQESQEQVVDNVARFVSLIPFVSDSAMFPGVCDIWSTCDQFLMMLQGDEEEHAVLLVNYFLHIGKKETWLLIGSAIPEGPTAYVLTREAGGYWIWNASTGEKFRASDNYCPVQSIGCLVGVDNVYANIQPYDHPGRMSLNVDRKEDWKPFFHKGFSNPGLSSVQPESLVYPATDPVYVMELQDKIERLLKERLMSWRPRHITHWNRYCIQEFRKLLIKLEKNKNKGQQQHTSELSQILQPYKMTGFPINMSYTEMEPLVEAVYSTGVHNIDTADVEFAIAVHIHPYPCSIMSVWIYVASLVKKR